MMQIFTEKKKNVDSEKIITMKGELIVCFLSLCWREDRMNDDLTHSQCKYAAIIGRVFGKCPSSHCAAICALKRVAKKTNGVSLTDRESEDSLIILHWETSPHVSLDPL